MIIIYFVGIGSSFFREYKYRREAATPAIATLDPIITFARKSKQKYFQNY